MIAGPRFILPRPRWVPATATLLAALGVFACASPTLPLPPPEQPTLTAGVDADHIALTAPCGGAEASAIIVVENTNPQVPSNLVISGAVATECGSWNIPSVYAHNGDVLSITQQFGGEISDSLELVVRVP